MTKRGLSFEQHQDLGLVLASMRDELLHRSIQVANAFPQADPAVRHLERALRSLEEARTALDNIVHRDFPQDAEPAIYYHDPDTRQPYQP